jgi:hypothetical protein
VFSQRGFSERVGVLDTTGSKKSFREREREKEREGESAPQERQTQTQKDGERQRVEF